jgi:4-alpha-glucanotransferase
MFNGQDPGAGALLHISSLPGPFGTGDLGPEARGFAGFLAESGLRYWQILPFHPTEGRYHYSPYQSPSAFAGNPLLISPDLLVEDGFISGKESRPPFGSTARADFHEAEKYKRVLIDRAFRFHQTDKAFQDFQSRESIWLRDFALFQALGRELKKPWHRWPHNLRDREPGALEKAEKSLAESIQREKFTQFIFFRQWRMLRLALKNNDVRLIGDCPIYIPHQSADVWSHAHLFQLDSRKRPAFVSGVPPDAFSRTGQLWGHPLFDWERLREERFAWWIRRLTFLSRMVDLIRLDHFRGLVAYWKIPARAKNAAKGEWTKAPADAFLTELQTSLSGLPLIAEDLGTITPDVVEVMKKFRLPGMKVLLFAFDTENSDNPHLPHNYTSESVAYTGTHDNNTVRGWYEEEASGAARKRLEIYIKKTVSAGDVHWKMIRLALSSPSSLAVIPVQDFLGLGSNARMNLPASLSGNWQWRLRHDEISHSLSAKIAALCRETQRL